VVPGMLPRCQRHRLPDSEALGRRGRLAGEADPILAVAGRAAGGVVPDDGLAVELAAGLSLPDLQLVGRQRWRFGVDAHFGTSSGGDASSARAARTAATCLQPLGSLPSRRNWKSGHSHVHGSAVVSRSYVSPSSFISRTPTRTRPSSSSWSK